MFHQQASTSQIRLVMREVKIKIPLSFNKKGSKNLKKTFIFYYNTHVELKAKYKKGVTTRNERHCER
jgi:hypothetical protein